MLRSLPPNRARLGRAFMIALIAFPALGAGDCAGLTGTDDADFDGTYTLYSVTAGGTTTYMSSGPFYMYGKSGDANSLRLTSGEWEVSGTTLHTTMVTVARYDGASQSPYTERHTGSIDVSGESATATLDNGTQIYATFGSDDITYSSGSATLRFRKD